MQGEEGGRLGRSQAASLRLPAGAEWEQEAVRQLSTPRRARLFEKWDFLYKCLKREGLLLLSSFPILSKSQGQNETQWIYGFMALGTISAWLGRGGR